MKILNSLTVLLLLIFCASINNLTKAQEEEGHPFIITTFVRAFPDNGRQKELDSLTTIWENNSFKGNQYVISYKIVRHWWGHDSRDYVQILELKNWDAINKAYDEANDLFKKAMPDKADRDKFYKAWNRYFTGHHSDEIYQVVTSGE